MCISFNTLYVAFFYLKIYKYVVTSSTKEIMMKSYSFRFHSVSTLVLFSRDIFPKGFCVLPVIAPITL